MSPKTRWILIIVCVLLLILVVVGVAYMAAKKSGSAGQPEKPPPPSQDQIDKPPQIGRFDLGNFTVTSRDEEMHYIKILVEVGYVGTLDKELEERKAELRDAINGIMMKLTIQRAKEDYIDRFLHKEIEKRLNEVLGTSTSDRRIVKVFIPEFLIN